MKNGGSFQFAMLVITRGYKLSWHHHKTCRITFLGARPVQKGQEVGPATSLTVPKNAENRKLPKNCVKNGRYPQKNAVFSWWKLPTIGLQGYPMFRPITRILSIHAETEWWGMVNDNFGGPWSAVTESIWHRGYQGFAEIDHICSIDEMSVLFGWFDPTKIDLFVESMKLGQFEASDFRIYQHELGTWKTSRWHR